MARNPFSRAEREVHRPLELPEPEPTALPPEMGEWVADDRVDGVAVEENVSPADMARRRGEAPTEAQLAGIAAQAALGQREHVAREVALARRELDRLTALAEGGR